MKLLFVHERFGALAGAEGNLFNVADALKRRGHACALLHGPGTGKAEAAWTALFTEKFPMGPTDNGALVVSALQSWKPDLVYVHKMADLEVIEALVASGFPLVRMVHDHDIYCMKSYKYAYFSRRICTRPLTPYCIFPCGAFVARNHHGGFPLRWVSYTEKQREVRLNQQFDRMVVVSDYMRQELLRNGFHPRTIEVHPPVPRMGDPGLRSSFSDRNLVIYAGQIIRGKGVDVLLEALARIQTPFEAVIFGEGNYRRYCEKLTQRLGLKDRVQFKGYVSQEELKNYYRECSVVVVSSVWPEPIATVGIEVMRYALPVVAFDAGGIKDWLRHEENGFLIDWMDRGELARRIEQLLRDKKLAQRMGERGLQIANEKYDFDRYIQSLEVMFESVLAERQHRAAVRPSSAVNLAIKR